MAVGAAFALGEAALGSFLVIGFILHNITEGIGIAAPLVSSKPDEKGLLPRAPSLLNFFWIGIISRFSGSTRDMDRRFFVLTSLRHDFPGYRTGSDLAGDRRSHSTPQKKCRSGENILCVMVEPGRVPDWSRNHVLYRFSCKVLEKKSK